MALLVDLPPELLIQTLSLVGSNLRTYSKKERQGDLAAFALVHRSLTAPAQHLLYTGNVLVRNAGRSALLARTLESNPELAERVRALNVESSQSDHPPSLVAILQCTNPTSLSLESSVFRGGAASAQLHKLLLRRSSMRSFTWEGHSSRFAEDIEPLLRAWEGLKELSLTFSDGFWPETLGVKPSYRLSKLALYPEPLLSRLDWAAGDTRDSLRHLSIGSPTVPDTPLRTRTVLSDEERSSQLLLHLTTLHLFAVYLDSTALRHILNRAPTLQHLSFGAEVLNNPEPSLSPTTPPPPPPFPFLPPLLRTLELHGQDRAKSIRLAEALEDDSKRPPRLDEVVLHELFPTDNEAREVARVCKAVGVRLEVRPF